MFFFFFFHKFNVITWFDIFDVIKKKSKTLLVWVKM